MRRFLLLAPLALLPLAASAQTEEEQARDRGFLTGLIEDNLSSTARQVTIEGFAGALSSRATIEELTIADQEGVWLRATDLALDWNRSALLRGRIEIEELAAGSIEVLRQPVPDPQAPSPEATPFALPELPVSVEIGELQVDRIALDESILGEALALSLAGTVNLEGGEGSAALAAEIIEGSEGSLAFTGSYSNETRVLSVDLDLEEAEGGLAARALGIPGLPSVALSVEGTAPIDDYAAELSLATDGEQRIAGDFALQTTEQPGPEGGVVERAFGLDVRGDVTPLVAAEIGDFFGEDVRLRTKGIRRSDGSLVLTSLGVNTRALDLRGSAEITPQGWPARIQLSGTLGAESEEPVPLPGAGGLTVEDATLEVSYDQAEGDAWTGAFEVEGLAGEGFTLPALTLEGGGTIVPAREGQPGRFTAALDYAAEGLAFTDPALAEALGADLSGEIALSRTEDGGPLQIQRLTLSGPGIEAQAEGTVAGAAEGFLTRSSVTLEAQDLARFAELTGLDLGGSANATVVSAVRPLDGIFDLALSGTTQDLALGIERLDPLLAGSGTLRLAAARDEGGTRVDDLLIDTDAVDLSAEADITSGASEAQFDLAVTDLGLAFPELSGPATLTGTFDRAASGEAVIDAEAALPGTAVSIDATQAASTPDPEGEPLAGPFSFDVSAEVEDLAASREVLATFAPDLALAPEGAATLSIEGTAAPDASTFDVTVAAETQGLALGIETLDPLLAGEGSLAGRALRTGPESFRVEDLSIDTGLLDGTVSAAFDEGAGRAELDLALADVAPVLEGLEGPARLSGEAVRGADGITALDLSATLPTGEARIEGTLAAPEDGLAFTGDVALDLSEIAPFAPLVGRDIAGAVEATLSGTVRPDLSVLDLAFEAETADLRVGLPQVAPLLAGSGTWSGEVERSPEGGLAFTLDAETPLLDAEAEGGFTEETGTASFDLNVADVAPLAPGLSGPASAVGTATRAPDGSIALDVDATAPGAQAAIDATVAPPEQGYEITGAADLSVANLAPWSNLAGRPLGGSLDATVTGSALPSLETFDLALEATASSLDIGVPAVAQLLAGTGTLVAEATREDGGPIRVETLVADFPNLDVTAQGTTAGGTGEVTFDARLADLGLFVPEFPGPVTATGTASLGADGRTAVNAAVTGPGGINAQVTGSLSGGTADLRAVGEAPLQIANAFLEPRRLSGPARFDLSLNGPLALESLSGTVTTEGARLADPGLGQAITGISGTATLSGGTAALDLAGSLAAGGRLAVTGSVGLAPPFEADLDVTGTGLVIRDPSLYEARGDGQISITGPLAGGALIQGAVDLSTVEIRVPSSGVGALGELPEVFHIEPSVPVQRTLERAGLAPDGTDLRAGAEEDEGGAGFALDLLLRAPSRVFVRGRGVDAELGGELRLTGTTDQVIPIGQFDLLRGRFSILGQRFELTEGSATLQGDFDPFLRLVAVTQARTGTTITITLEGPATEPTVTFSSQPELPEDEVLAQLLFGVDIGSLTPFQAVQLASAAAELAGSGGGLTDRFRSGAGLADFDVTTDATGGLALRLGQYLTENVYTDVIVSQEQTEATINLDLTPDLTVRAGADTEGETSLGIFFERDY